MVKNKILKRIVAGLSCIALSTTMLTSLPAFADDYVDEYQYYSTLDPNGEEYQEWKSNLASSAVSVPQNRMLKSILKNNTLIANDYIEFNTASNGHYTIGTIGGNPNSSTDDNKKMLFGHPGGGTSKTTIVVGESINEFTSSNVTYDADGSKSVSKASYDGVDVTQELSIIENSATGRDDVVKIKYIVKNDTEYAKQVGIRIMMDTMLGGNDAAPFRVNGSDVTTETVYSGSNIPQIWQAFDSATNPGVVAQGTFYKSGDRKPDKVQFTNWGNVTSTLWDYVTQPGRSNGDSAVSITWNKDTFTSGETREFVTYYGLSELEQNLIPPLALSVYADNISKQITAGTPFWGAPTMLCVLSTGDLSYIIGGLGVAESLFTSFELPSVLVNLGSCYDLLPNKDYTDDWQWIYSYKRTYDHWYDYFIDNGNFTYFTFDEFDELISDDYNNYLWIDGKYNHSRIKISQNNTNNLKRIALVGSNRNTISTIQHCPGDRGLQFVPEYGIGDSVVPIESATMNFNHDLLDIKIFDQDHMGLIQSQECIDEILKNIKDTKSFMKLPMRTKMANNNLTSNAIEETKTLSNKLAISGYFDLFFSNETCSYYYTNSEVHEGNNFKFDPLTSVGNPILLAQFADDNYDCKINSLADQNTDIMCNIDGNIYLYTNISVNSGSVLFLNLSDGSFFINIDLDNDGEIDTTVTPTINPGVIQDDEKSPEITVESCNAGISNSNTINPNIVITNNSDKPLKMSDITINYVFNADNKENLEYHCDWLAVDNQYLGNTSVCEFVNDDYGNTYAKIKFNTDVELQPNKQFVIHFRLNAADWSNWDTSNDYSMGTEQLLPNDKIIVFYNEQLISGVQP